MIFIAQFFQPDVKRMAIWQTSQAVNFIIAYIGLNLCCLFLQPILGSVQLV